MKKIWATIFTMVMVVCMFPAIECKAMPRLTEEAAAEVRAAQEAAAEELPPCYIGTAIRAEKVSEGVMLVEEDETWSLVIDGYDIGELKQFDNFVIIELQDKEATEDTTTEIGDAFLLVNVDGEWKVMSW